MAELIVRKIGIILLLMVKGVMQVALFILKITLSGIKIFLMLFVILARVVLAMVGIASGV